MQGTASVYSERVAGGRYIKVDIQRVKAARFGLNISDIQQVVATAIGGMNVTQTVEGLERYPVSIRYHKITVIHLSNWRYYLLLRLTANGSL